MRRAPFNTCDYLCDRCRETAYCDIFALLRSKALSGQMEGKADGLHGASIEDVKESLDETMEVLKAIAAGLTVEPDESAGFSSLDKCSVDDDALYRLAQTFTAKTHAFLKNVEPFVSPGKRRPSRTSSGTTGWSPSRRAGPSPRTTAAWPRMP